MNSLKRFLLFSLLIGFRVGVAGAQDSTRIIYNDHAIYEGSKKLFSCERDRRDAITEVYTIRSADKKEQATLVLLKSGTMFQLTALFPILAKRYFCYIADSDISAIIKTYLTAGVLQKNGEANFAGLENYCKENGFRLVTPPPAKDSDSENNPLPSNNSLGK